MDPITVVLDQKSVKFTPDGKVAVLDAIASLCAGRDHLMLWESLLVQQPELVNLCELYPFSSQACTWVTDRMGWDKIQSALFEHLLEKESSI